MIKKVFFILSFFWISLNSWGQNIYFPPLFSDEWETITPETLDWCENEIVSLYDFLEFNNTKSFIVLKDGKIVLEKYFGTFEQDSSWYWASAAKTLTAFMTGLAQEEGFLDIQESSNHYLQSGWTSCSQNDEDKISILNHLTMTSGLDDGLEDPDCTNAACLHCLADPGSRWSYHNAPYTMLDNIISAATGNTLNNFILTRLQLKTGISGAFFKVAFNNIFVSKPRAMARFGLLILNKGIWDEKQIMTDTSFFNHMVNTSQELNKSYGYFWWLNGKESFMVPGLQNVFPGSLHPNAPDDMISALGKNGQILNVVPSMNLVMVRMGNAPEGASIGMLHNDEIWKRFNKLSCQTSQNENTSSPSELTIYPNPVESKTTIKIPGRPFEYSLFNISGNKTESITNCYDEVIVDMSGLVPGLYYIRINIDEEISVYKALIKH